jgi:hypothetical protein
MDCTAGINGRCHIKPKSNKQFSERDACKKLTETYLKEASCLNALFDCECVGGPKISEDKCSMLLLGRRMTPGCRWELRVRTALLIILRCAC